VVTADTATAPDGAVSADTVAIEANGYFYTNISYTTSGVHTGSVYLRASSPVSVQLRMSNSAGTETATGTVNVTTTWTRFSRSVTWTVNPVSAQLGLDVRALAGGSGAAVTVEAWGWQIEAGAYATSYIPTAGAAVARAFDQGVLPLSAFNFNLAEGAYCQEASVLSNAQGTSGVIVQDGTINNNHRVAIQRNSTNGGGLTVQDGGVTQADIFSSGAISVNVPHKMACAYATNDFANSFDSLGLQTDSSGTVPTSLTTIYISGNANFTGYRLNGHLRRLRYWPKRLPNATLQALTQ
jgi:hypothetical protein